MISQNSKYKARALGTQGSVMNWQQKNNLNKIHLKIIN